MQLRKQLVIAAFYFGGKVNLPPALIPAMSKDMDEQLKLAQKVIAVVGRAERTIIVTLLQYSVDEPEFLCSSPVVCREKGGRVVSTSCQREL